MQPSGPFSAMHSSRGIFVTGHEQQIFFPLFPTFGLGLSSPMMLRDAIRRLDGEKSRVAHQKQMPKILTRDYCEESRTQPAYHVGIESGLLEQVQDILDDLFHWPLGQSGPKAWPPPHRRRRPSAPTLSGVTEGFCSPMTSTEPHHINNCITTHEEGVYRASCTIPRETVHTMLRGVENYVVTTRCHISCWCHYTTSKKVGASTVTYRSNLTARVTGSFRWNGLTSLRHTQLTT